MQELKSQFSPCQCQAPALTTNLRSATYSSLLFPAQRILDSFPHSLEAPCQLNAAVFLPTLFLHPPGSSLRGNPRKVSRVLCAWSSRSNKQQKQWGTWAGLSLLYFAEFFTITALDLKPKFYSSPVLHSGVLSGIHLTSTKPTGTVQQDLWLSCRGHSSFLLWSHAKQSPGLVEIHATAIIQKSKTWDFMFSWCPKKT